MSIKAKPTLIGAFIASAAALFIAGLFLLGSGSWFTQKGDFIIYFPESVNGLTIGAPVKFRGVQIGEVKRVLIHYNQSSSDLSIPVIITVDYTRLRKQADGLDDDFIDEEDFLNAIESGLRGKLEFQSIVTGVLYVELDYYKNAPPAHPVQLKPLYREIPSLESTSSDIVKSVTETIRNISEIDFKQIATRLDSVLTEVDGGLKELDFKAINDHLVAVLAEAEGGLKELDFKTINAKLIAALDGARELTTDPEIKEAVAKFHKTLGTADEALAAVRDTMRPDSSLRYELDRTLFELGAAARSFRQLADYLDRNPSALLTGRPLEKSPQDKQK